MTKRSKRRRSPLVGDDLLRRLERAFAHHQAGRVAEAGRDYAQVVRSDPGQAEAWHGFGVLALQRGENANARERLERAVALVPERGDYLSNLGAACEATGNLERAREVYARALALEPDDVDTLFNSALVEAQLDAPGAACAALERAVSLAPGDAELWLSLSRYALAAEDPARSRAACDRGAKVSAAELRPQFDAQRAHLAQTEGDLEGAEAHYRRAIEADPVDPRHLAGLGEVLQARGSLEAAETHYRRALEIAPDLRATRINLAGLVLARGQPEVAFEHYWALYREAPDADPGLDRALARVLRHAYPNRWDRQMQTFLLASFADEAIDPEDLASAAAAQIMADPRLALEARLANATPEAMLLDGGTARPLVLAALRSTPNRDPKFESLLIEWRRCLLAHSLGHAEVAPERAALLGAFAEQALLNEYLWPISEHELAQVAKAEDALALALGDAPTSSAVVVPLLCYGMYRSPAHLDGALLDRLLGVDLQRWPPAHHLVRTAVRELRSERKLAAALPQLGAIDEATSRAVREQYEGFPYPRWSRIPNAEREHLRDFLVRQFPDVEVEACSPWLRGEFRALVAGCGTGQEPLRLAMACPQSQIFGVDLSRASLGYAEAKRRELGVENLSLHHADLLQAGRLGQFEVVVANGVLHHMANPEHGLRVLRGILAPRGLMKIGLYSERARGAVVTARQIAKEHQWEGDAEGIAHLRGRILAGDPPELSALANSDDFYTSSGCRDLLFHACEHRFTLAEISALIERFDLELLGFEMPEGMAGERFRATDERRSQIERWAAVEQAHPATFAGMYQFWVRAPESSVSKAPR